MAGYWLSSFFACLWTETKSRCINSQKKRTRPISSHLDRTNLVNKGFITWLLGKFCLRDTAGSPEWARWLHLARSGSQSQRAIWFILPARRTSHIIIEVILCLSAAPTFTVSPDKLSLSFKMLPVGNSVKLDCSAEGNPRPTVTWYKDGARFLKREGGVRLYLSQWTFMLNILDVVPTDTGKYTCNVSNAHGWINHTYYVDVHRKIKVLCRL